MIADLLAETRDVVRSVWSGRLGLAGDAFSQGVHLSERDDLDVVVVVRLDAAVVAVGPASAVDRLGSLEVDELSEAPAVLAALAPSGGRLLASASLAYADRGTVRDSVPDRVHDRVLVGPGDGSRVAPASAEQVRDVLTACSPAERDESGLAEMASWSVSLTDDGAAAGAAGFEVWPTAPEHDGGLAHLGVAVASSFRGSGHGVAAGAAAISAALDRGLVPQWRASVDNPTSLALGVRLGCRPIGHQLVVTV